MKISEQIPRLCPLKYHLDPSREGFWMDSIPDPEDPACYLQKFKSTDSVRVQFWGTITDDTGSAPTIVATLVDVNGVTVQTVTVYSAMTGITADDLIFYRFKYDLSGFDDGTILYSVLSFTDADGERVRVSEPFIVDDTISNTVLLTYSNSRNAYDVNFGATDAIFYLRVEGGFWSEGFTPASKDVAYFNQSHDPQILTSIPFQVKRLTFGDGGGIPNWMADKINRVFSCDTVLVDDVAMVKNEGAKLEPNREKLYPMAGWSIELLEATNNYSD